MTDALITHGVDVAVNWTLCYETFSFTSYEAILAGAMMLVRADAENATHLITTDRSGTAIAHKEELLRIFEDGTVLDLLRQYSQSRSPSEGWWPMVRPGGSRLTEREHVVDPLLYEHLALIPFSRPRSPSASTTPTGHSGFAFRTVSQTALRRTGRRAVRSRALDRRVRNPGTQILDVQAQRGRDVHRG